MKSPPYQSPELGAEDANEAGAFGPETSHSAPSKRGRRSQRRFLMIAGALAALLATAFIAAQIAVRDRAVPGASVAGVPVRGQSASEIRQTLSRQLLPRISAVRVTTPEGKTMALSLADLGLHLDLAATSQATLAAGRRRTPLGLSLWVPGAEAAAEPVVRLDTAAPGLERLRRAVDRPARDAALRLRGVDVEIVAAREGVRLDDEGLMRAVREAVSSGRPYAGAAPLVAIPPEVTTEQAHSRVGAAARYLAGPLTLRYRSRTLSLSPTRIATMLTVNTGADAATYPLTFRNSRARTALRRLFSWAETPPVDARIIVNAKGGMTVTRSRAGELLDIETLVEDLDDAAAGKGLRTVFVALRPAMPKLSTEEATRTGLASVGSQFTTYFDPRNSARAQNIARAAKLVDGTVVSPGETFSLNAVMGPRTLNRGFDYAPVIASDNVLRQGVGGGICQYATTLFNAVFFAGLPVVERHAHSFYISHYPVGRDATVSWGGTDFRFRNDTNRSLTIRSWVDGDELAVALVGKTGRRVSLVTSSFYAIRKPAHGRDDPRVIVDEDLGPGIVRWESGVAGRSVKVTRTVRNSTGNVLFRDTYVSRYKPLDWVKRVGI